MSRDDRRREETPLRLALLETDADRTDERLDGHDQQFKDVGKRFEKIEETSGANRTAFWTSVGTILVAFFTGLVSVLVVVIK